MLAVISPAKKLRSNTRQLATSQPLLLAEAQYLADVMKDKTPSDLRGLMGISEKLAELNVERYQLFETPFTDENSEPASMMFAGDTYVGLDAESLSDADLAFAQAHLGILSGLYGLLRPLDLAQPYRLEMGTRLANKRGKDLYAYWGDLITDRLNALTEGHKDRSIINLASKEYFSSVNENTLAGDVVTPVFKEIRSGKAKVISFMAKRARGAMARYLVENRLEAPGDLTAFNVGGYEYQPSISTPTEIIFHRAG